jgi:hypothetical protein
MLIMTRYLWTGESEFCICGHRITDHETCQTFIAIATQEPPTVSCGGGNKCRVTQDCKCECDEFRPYRIASEDEVIEKQYSEVITKQDE